MNNNKLVVILGPTASGKTDLAKGLMEKFNFEVISADSRQIFKYMDIGTGKDTTFFQHMIDIVHPNDNYSAFQYQKDTYKIIDDIFSRKNIPLIVGGSMMYIDAVIEGYQFSDTNDVLRSKIEKMSDDEIFEALFKSDPNLAEKYSKNRRRLVRALEISTLNSRSKNEYTKNKPSFDCLIIGVDIPRPELYLRIDQRVDSRINMGMVEEIKNLLKIGVSKDRLYDFGLEYRHILNYLNNPTDENLKLEIQKLKFKIHAFARRQLVWWRKNKKIHWIKSSDDAEKLISNFLNIK
jgi:tRNA dimethylallyltransferase